MWLHGKGVATSKELGKGVATGKGGYRWGRR